MPLPSPNLPWHGRHVMLNRLSPRSRISMTSLFRVGAFALSVNVVLSSPTGLAWPGGAASGAATASASEPRAIVPSGGCRFAPSSLTSIRGLSCMSCRQAETEETTARKKNRPKIFNLFFDIDHLFRRQALEEGAALCLGVFPMVRFDADEAAIL